MWFRKQTTQVKSKSNEMLHDVYDTVKPVCNDHLYNKTYYLWFIQ